METRIGFRAGGRFYSFPPLTSQEIDAALDAARKVSPLGRPACDNRRDFRLRLVLEYFTADDRNRYGVSTRQFRDLIDGEALTIALNALMHAAEADAMTA